MASPDVASRADDDGENDDAWRVGGFRVFGARTSPLRQKRGPLSVQDFLRASAAASDAATDRTPLGRLFPGNAGLHRRAAAASRLRRSREDAPEDRASGQNASSRLRSSSDVPARDSPSPSPSPTPAPAPVFAPAPRAGLARRLDLTPDTSAFANPSPPRPPAAVPPTFVSAIDRALHRAREANGIRTIHPQTPTVERKPSETIVSKARAVDVDVPHAANASAVDPARVARRRHRRRLAVIVVQQWKWFAADALETLPARMHREWRTRRETVRAWRRVARDGTDGTAVDENEAKADKIDAFARARRARTLLAAFVLWECNARDARLASARLARAASHHRARLLAPTLPAWRDAMWHARRRRVRRARAEGFRRRFVASIAFRAWRFAAERRRVAARLAEALDAARDAAMESRAFAEWRATVARERTREAVALARFRRDAEREFRRRAFVDWRLVSDSRRSKRLRRRAARAHRDRVVVSMATRSWAAWVAYASDVRAKGAALASRFSRDASRRAFRAWRFESLGVARLARARDARVTRTVTNRWRATATVSARARSEAETRFATIRLATLREAAATWRDATRARARERVVERLADAHASRLCVFSRFTAWVNRVAAVRAEAAAVRFAIETTTRRCVGGWRARTEYKRRRDALRRVAARHRHDASRRFAFRGWRDVADVEWNRRERRHLAREHRRRARLISAFSRWSGSFLERAARVADAAMRMRERRHEENLRTTIRAWTVAALDSKRRRRAFERAEAHAAAVVVHRAATAWRLATEEARARRASEDARVDAAAFAVARLRRDRIFDAWLERSRVGAIVRVQLERADDAFHRRTRRRRFDAWRVFLGEARRRREKTRRAIFFRNRSLAYAGLEAFVTAVVRRRAKKEANATAVSHFRTTRTTACVSAWRRRVQDERIARKNLADAAESHRKWLLREGCAAWLREGLHRREWCAAEATRVAARTYADALRRAEPYARRWRHKTLGARARRRRILGECAFSGGCGGASGDGFSPSALGFPERAPTLPTLPTLRPEPSPETTTLATSLGRTPAVRGASAAESRDAFHARVERLCAPPPRPPRPKPRRPSMDSDDASNGAVVGVDERVTGRETSRASEPSSFSSAAVCVTPAKLREYESVIVEFEALRSEAARLRRDADALAPRDGASTDDAAAMAAAARRRVLAAAAAHLRRRRAELLPAVRAAAAALGEARDDLASVASGFSLS